MGVHCCNHTESLLKQQRQALYWILCVNIIVLVGEVWGGVVGHSHALLADSVHLLSHILVIVLSLFALSRGSRWQARAALIKGLLVLGLGFNILFEASIAWLIKDKLPDPGLMGLAAILALAGNMVNLWIIARRRNDDLNMRSTWICSQADLWTNFGLIVASSLVAWFGSMWPDFVVSLFLSFFILYSAAHVIWQSLVALKSVD